MLASNLQLNLLQCLLIILRVGVNVTIVQVFNSAFVIEEVVLFASADSHVHGVGGRHLSPSDNLVLELDPSCISILVICSLLRSVKLILQGYRIRSRSDPCGIVLMFNRCSLNVTGNVV